MQIYTKWLNRDTGLVKIMKAQLSAKSKVNDWIEHKTEKELNYRKNKKLLDSFKSIHDLAIFMQNELRQHSLTLGKLTIKNVIDRSNGKPRTYVIEEPLRQLYGYVAYFGLDDLKHKIGPHQYHSDGRGPLDAVKCSQKWMNTNNVEYAVKMDLRHCYQSIHHNYVIRHRIEICY